MRLTALFKSLSRFDRMCSKCRSRQPIRGGRIVNRGGGAERFICGGCRPTKETT